MGKESNSDNINNVYFDYLRVIAVFFVVIIHVVAQVWNSVNVAGMEFAYMNMYDSLSRWAVPAYVMISGALFLGKKREIKQIYKKNILRLVLVFLVWSLIYALTTGSGAGFYLTVVTVIGGHFHMWFILMIIGMYMMLPLFYKIAEDKKLVEYLLVLAFIFTSLLPWLYLIGQLLNNAAIMSLASTVMSNSGFMNVSVVSGYIGYFFAGYYINETDISSKTRKIIYILGAVGFLSTFFLTRWLCISINCGSVEFYGDTRVNIVFTVIAVFVWAKYNLSKPLENSFSRKLLRFLGRSSLHAYMVHVLVILWIEKYAGINGLFISPLLAIPLLSLMVFILSFILGGLIQFVIDKIKEVRVGKLAG